MQEEKASWKVFSVAALCVLSGAIAPTPLNAQDRRIVGQPILRRDVGAGAGIGAPPRVGGGAMGGAGNVVANPRPWPPQDESANIIFGSKRMGTAEQMGWPMYACTPQERARYETGGVVRVISKTDRFVIGTISN